MGVGMVRLGDQGTPKAGGRLGQFALLLQHASEIIVRVGMVWHEPQSLLIIRGGLIEPAQFLQSDAEVDECSHKVGPEKHGLLQAGERFSRFAVTL